MEWATVGEAFASLAPFFGVTTVLLTASGHSFIVSDEDPLQETNVTPVVLGCACGPGVSGTTWLAFFLQQW